MGRALVHGIGLEHSTEGLPADPLGSFFDLFPEAADDAPADVTIALRRAREGANASIEGDYAPFFFHGGVQTYRGPAGLLVDDGSSRITISADARVLRGEIAVTPDGDFPELTEGLLHVALLWALRARRMFDVHAAGVVHDDGAPVVIVGDSGAGKTTLMLALLEAGFGYLGDDRVLLRREAGALRPVACSYPREFHVGTETLERFPRLARVAGPPRGVAEKHSVDPALAYPTAHRLGGAPPSVLLFTRVGHVPETVTRALPQAEAFGRLLDASAILAVEGMPYRDENISCLRDLVVATPCYEVVAGYDVLAAPAAVVRALEPIRRLRAA